MVRFSDRGLVLQGRPNLKLFNQLFWLILVPYCCIGLMMAPFNSIIRGDFPEKYVAKHCIRPPGFKGVVHQEPQTVMKQVVVPMVSALLNLVWCQYWTYKVRKYFRGICPNKKMYSFGNYRRNFVTFEQNVKYIQMHFVFWIIIDLALTGSHFSLTTKEISLVQNTLSFFYFDIFHGIYLPAKMIIPRNVNITKPFWQTKTIPEPRRGKEMLNSKPLTVKRVMSPFMQEKTSAEPSFGEIVTKREEVGEKAMSREEIGEKVRRRREENWKKPCSLGDATVHLVTVEIH